MICSLSAFRGFMLSFKSAVFQCLPCSRVVFRRRKRPLRLSFGRIREERTTRFHVRVIPLISGCTLRRTHEVTERIKHTVDFAIVLQHVERRRRTVRSVPSHVLFGGNLCILSVIVRISH